MLSPAMLDTSSFNASGALLFALSGCLFPAVVTLLTFEANRRVGPSVTGALGNLSPLFADSHRLPGAGRGAARRASSRASASS